MCTKTCRLPKLSSWCCAGKGPAKIAPVHVHIGKPVLQQQEAVKYFRVVNKSLVIDKELNLKSKCKVKALQVWHLLEEELILRSLFLAGTNSSGFEDI